MAAINNTNNLSSSRLQELIAMAKAKQAAAMLQQTASSPASETSKTETELNLAISAIANNIPAPQVHGFTWNAQQQTAISLVASGKSCVIVGSAGTGKTTLMREAARLASIAPWMPMVKEDTGSAKNPVLQKDTAGIVACSFTKSAVENIRKNVNGAVPCFTIHRLLEFSPVKYQEWDNEAQREVTKTRFEPLRNAANPLPAELKTIIIEESGIVNIRLFNQLLEALPFPQNVQFIFLGDLFQLDPPYDPAILGFALDCIPVVELTQVYRQALESPILAFAIAAKEGQTFGSQHFAELSKTTESGSLTIKPWKHRIDEFKATMEAAKFMRKEWEAGRYNPDNSAIILPFNKRFGSIELNKLIADFIGKARGAVVHEVIAGFNKYYFAVGDDISYQKINGKIVKITKNMAYHGKQTPQPASQHLDRFGFNSNGNDFSDAALLEADSNINEEIERLMEASLSDSNEQLKKASHIIDIELEDGQSITLDSSGQFNTQVFDFSYARTCYKAQGSEWDNVYVFTHKSHAVSLCNEFYYTAATRAKKALTLIVEPDHLMKALKKQSIPGMCWQEKAAHFKTQTKMEAMRTFKHLNEMLQFWKANLN